MKLFSIEEQKSITDTKWIDNIPHSVEEIEMDEDWVNTNDLGWIDAQVVTKHDVKHKSDTAKTGFRAVLDHDSVSTFQTITDSNAELTELSSPVTMLHDNLQSPSTISNESTIIGLEDQIRVLKNQVESLNHQEAPQKDAVMTYKQACF